MEIYFGRERRSSTRAAGLGSWAGAGEESQVVVTGNLTDRLSIGYGVGVFSPIAELTLRYKLWRNLYLEAVSGASQAVDLVYTFSLPGRPPSP